MLSLWLLLSVAGVGHNRLAVKSVKLTNKPYPWKGKYKSLDGCPTGTGKNGMNLSVGTAGKKGFRFCVANKNFQQTDDALISSKGDPRYLNGVWIPEPWALLQPKATCRFRPGFSVPGPSYPALDRVSNRIRVWLQGKGGRTLDIAAGSYIQATAYGLMGANETHALDYDKAFLPKAVQDAALINAEIKRLQSQSQLRGNMSKLTVPGAACELKEVMQHLSSIGRHSFTEFDARYISFNMHAGTEALMKKLPLGPDGTFAYDVVSCLGMKWSYPGWGWNEMDDWVRFAVRAAKKFFIFRGGLMKNEMDFACYVVGEEGCAKFPQHDSATNFHHALQHLLGPSWQIQAHFTDANYGNSHVFWYEKSL